MKFTFPPESRPLAGFTIKRAIYRGGFGEVYYGLSDAGREVALKLLQHNTDVELRGVQQCLNLSHPNLVTIFDVRQDEDGDHWIVMEYIAGETLEAAMRRYPQGMPVEVVRQWLPGMIAGISFLHRCGLVHRDLKPANLFCENGVVKVGDVGLSKFIAPSRHSAHTQSVGTIYYMAPEVAKGRYEKAVDIYALGVILYEMLTGKLPFQGESTGEILMKHLTERPDLTALPPRLQNVIAKALEKDPGARFATPEALMHAFDMAVVGRSTRAEIRVVEPAPATEEFVAAKRTPSSVQRHAGSRQSHRKQLLHLWWLPIAALVLIWIIRSGHHASPSLFSMVLVGGVVAFYLVRRRERDSLNAAHGTFAGRLKPERHERSEPQRSRLRRTSAAPFTSALLIVPFTVLLSSLLAVLRPNLFQIPGADQIDPGLMGFFLAVSIVAGWGITLLPVLFSSPLHDGRVSRWSFLILGGLVGTAAWQLNQFLMVHLPTTGEYEVDALFNRIGEHSLIIADTGPTWIGFTAFFCSLFALRNWNHLSNSTRSARFRVGSVLLTMLMAWAATKLFEFPLPWALAWAAILSCSVQLASPWGAPRPRRQNFKDHRCNWQRWC